jgi:cytidylate kinase
MNGPTDLLVIAIDGPAASGKGTLARRLADHYGLPHLDTGLTYRAVARALLLEDLSLDDENLAGQVAAALDMSALDRDQLSEYGVGEAASRAVRSSPSSAISLRPRPAPCSTGATSAPSSARMPT